MYDLLITTAWFKCEQDNHHNFEERYKCIENFFELLKLPGANVFCECYTNDYEKLNEIKKQVDVHNINLIDYPLEQLKVYKHKKYFDDILPKIPKNTLYGSSRIVNSDILTVWNSKIDLLFESSKNNCSKHYCWLDIGTFRNGNTIRDINKWNINSIPDLPKILINHIERFCFNNKIFGNFVNIAGGCIITKHIICIEKLHKLFYLIVDNLVKLNTIIKCSPAEEIILKACVDLYPDLFLINQNPNWGLYYDYLFEYKNNDKFTHKSPFNNLYDEKNNTLKLLDYLKLIEIIN